MCKEKEYTVRTILGTDIVKEYNSKGKVDKDEVNCISFQTEKEKNAYIKGIDDATGWMESAIVSESEITADELSQEEILEILKKENRENEFTAMVIFGTDTVYDYMETGETDIDEVKIVHFLSEEELNAYIKGIDDATGWMESAIVNESEITD